jgi:tripartite-type tricarboxylate transporter receptor subunit TctC
MRRLSLVGALVALAALVTAALATAAQAETYPSHPISLMVGFPPGGPTDTLARILAEAMGKILGQTVVIEDVTGAGGTIATGRVVHATADGYTIGIGNWTSHVGSPAMYPLDYDIVKDLQPVSLLTSSPLWVLGKNGLPPKTPAELFAWLKAQNQPVTFGTVGTGSPAYLVGVQLAKAIGVHFQFVPYRGAAPAMTDLIGGQIDMACLEASGSYPNVAAGRFKAYAVTSDKRWPKSPDTPTMIEAGVPDVSISFWHGLWVTKGTPAEVINQLNGAVKTALADPAVRQRIEGLGQVIFPADQQNPTGLAAYQTAEIKKWWPVMKAAGLKASN